MANFGDDMDDDEETPGDVPMDENSFAEIPDERLSSFPTGSCIVCQENLEESKTPYGMLCYLQQTTLHRFIDCNDVENLKRIMKDGKNFDVTTANGEDNNDQVYSTAENNLNGSRLSRIGYSMGACGHLMHVSCFENYLRSIDVRQSSQPTRNHPEVAANNEFMCPLCKSLGNSLLPVIWKSRMENVNWRGSKVQQNEQPSDDSFLVNSMVSHLSADLKSISTNSSPFDSIAGAVSTHNFTVESTLVVEPHIERLFSSMPKLHKCVEVTSMEAFSSSKMPGSLVELSDVNLTTIRKFYNNHLLRNIKKMYGIKSGFQVPDGFQICCALFETFNTSLSMAELSSRGVKPNWVPTGARSDKASLLPRIGVLDTLNNSTLDSLKVMAETCNSSLILADHSIERQLRAFCSSFLYALTGKGQHTHHVPLLFKDGVSHLVSVSFSVIPYFDMDKEHIFYYIRLFSVFEGTVVANLVVRCLVSLIESTFVYTDSWMFDNKITDLAQESTKVSDDRAQSILNLVEEIAKHLSLDAYIPKLRRIIHPAVARHLIEGVMLVYARKCAIFLYARFGYAPPGGAVGFGHDISKRKEPSHSMEEDEPSEYLRLASYLGLPSIDGLISRAKDEPALNTLVQQWCVHLINHDQERWAKLRSPDKPMFSMNQQIVMEQPVVFQLIPLPNRLDVLLESALERVCDTCGTIPHDPAICLFCGTYVLAFKARSAVRASVVAKTGRANVTCTWRSTHG
jgi:E3 ubiquitin-protein ligase UBR1